MVPITLDIRQNRLVLKDSFLFHPNNSSDPEEFAKTLVSDIGLPDTFTPLIAFSIREQVISYMEFESTRLGMLDEDGMDDREGAVTQGSRWLRTEMIHQWEPKLEVLSKKRWRRLRE